MCTRLACQPGYCHPVQHPQSGRGHFLRARLCAVARYGRCHARAGIPLLSLEGAAPVASFDIVGMHVPHEMAVTNFLEALDLAGIPLLAADRTEDDPIIIAGGPSVYNPEPYAAFFDAILIGEARSRCSRFASCIAACATRASRALRLSSSSRGRWHLCAVALRGAP